LDSPVELERWLTDMESDRVERKPSLNEREQLRQTICAFANQSRMTSGSSPVILD